MSRVVTLGTLLTGLLLAAGCDQNMQDGQQAGTRNSAARDIERAVCVLMPIGDSGVSGQVEFVEVDDGVQVTGKVMGLEPGQHGFHVHAYGDLTDRESGKSAGSHYDPTKQPHGRRTDEERHVGDLGNIVANDAGVAEIDLTDDVIALNGAHSIVGRCIIVHAGEDQFTQPVGDAGARVAGGVIGIAAASE